MQRNEVSDYLRGIFPKIEDDELSYLLKVYSREVDGYRDFKRRKPNGRTRSISIPDYYLLKLQRDIFKQLKDKVAAGQSKHKNIYISSSAHAYVEGRSPLTAAQVHSNTKWAIKVDLKSFFDHVTEVHVYKALRGVLPAREVSMVARFCTRFPTVDNSDLPAKHRRFRRVLRPNVISSLSIPRAPRFKRDLWFGIGGHPIEDLEKGSFSTTHRLPPKRLHRWHKNGGWFFRYAAEPSWLEFLDEFRLKTNKAEKLMKNYRKFLFTYLNPRFISRVSQDSRQEHYDVRPDQIRWRNSLGYLPQGSPTSGLLANMVMRSFDETLRTYCNSASLRYTRYSDDIFISSNKNNFDRNFALKLISVVQQLSEVHGFTLNKEKTKILTPGSRKFMLGLLVDGEKPRLGRQDKDRIKHAIWSLATNGRAWNEDEICPHRLNETHFLRDKRQGSYASPNCPSDPFHSLIGWLAYCSSVDREFLYQINSWIYHRKWKFREIRYQYALLAIIKKMLSQKTETSQAKLSSEPKHIRREIEDLF